MSEHHPHRRRLLRTLLAFVLTAFATVTSLAVTAAPAHADGCYTWGRTLSEGMSGSDVTQLQIRVAGWGGYHNVIALDGIFGSATTAAVKRFQSAYGLASDGIAGPNTFNKIYALQDDDCTPIHFSYAELNRCNSDWSGGAVWRARPRPTPAG